jgi:two-component system, cell cycle sensor histidine kinase DivJ
LSSSGSFRSDFLAEFAAGCDRLVRPDVTDAGERTVQRRLIGLMFAAPFVLGAAAFQAVPALTGTAGALVAVFALFGLTWFSALLVAATGRWRAIAAVAALLAAGAIGVGTALSGGLVSPLAILLLAPAIETCWLAGSRRAGLAAGAATFAAFLAATPLAASLGTSGAASAWHWLPVAVYGMTLMLRFGRAGERGEDARAPQIETPDLFDEFVVMTLNPAGEVRTVSPNAADRLGLPSSVLLGTGFFERVHLADRLVYLNALADLRRDEARCRVEARLRLPAKAKDASVDAFRPTLLDMRRVGEDVVMVLSDHSEVAALRAALARSEERAEGTEATKSRFLAAVSHELRTPLNAIIGFSDMLVHKMFGPFADPRQAEYAGLIRDSGNHLLSVVNAILDVSKIEAGTYPIVCEEFDFSDAARMSVSMLQLQAAEKSIELIDETGPAIGTLRGDRRAVQQIMINLLSNAVKFTPEGGEVRLGARRSGERLRFWVSDTGIGMAEGDLARVGRPFMQVQNDYTRQFEGAGLGLSLVKGLVALHEGTMSIESAPGEGTVVTITLPMAGPAGGEADDTASSGRIIEFREDRNGPLRKTA